MSMYDREWYRQETEARQKREAEGRRNDFHTNNVSYKKPRAAGKKLLSALGIVLVLIISFSSRLPLDTLTHRASSPDKSPSAITDEGSLPRSDPAVSDSAEAMMTDKDLYQAIYEGLLSRDAVISVTYPSVDDVKNVFTRIILEHPELFWLSGGCMLSHWSDRNLIQITPKPYDISGIAEKESLLNQAVLSLLSLVPVDATDYEKALFVHDYIVNTTEYDQDAYLDRSDSEIPPEYAAAYTAYGCLVEHRAVCEGYAKAFQLLMNSFGIPCGRLSGSVLGGGDHSWNYITLGGEEYYIDVTWDDSQFHDGRSMCSHQYCFITSDELLQSHIPDENQYIPLCTADRYDYFKHSGYYVQDYYEFKAAAVEIIRDQPDEWVEIKFLNAAQCSIIVQNVIEEHMVYEYPGFEACTGMEYFVSDSGRVLGLIFHVDG